MKTPFNRYFGLIIVPLVVEGPLGTETLEAALDTGCTRTIVNARTLKAIGCDPASYPARHQLTTAGGVSFVPLVTVTRLLGMGHVRRDFPVVAHSLPQSSSAHALLGLDFLRNQNLLVDFRAGWLELS